MALSESAKTKILNGLVGKDQYGIASTSYLGLLKSITPGTEKVQFVEPDVSAGYGRVQIGHWQNSSGQLMGTASNGKISNTGIIYLPEATADWGTVTYFALFSSATGGSPVLWGALSDPVNIPSGYVPLFRVGKLSISIE